MKLMNAVDMRPGMMFMTPHRDTAGRVEFIDLVLSVVYNDVSETADVTVTVLKIEEGDGTSLRYLRRMFKDVCYHPDYWIRVA